MEKINHKNKFTLMKKKNIKKKEKHRLLPFDVEKEYANIVELIDI
jgi:hypothetical protein